MLSKPTIMKKVLFIAFLTFYGNLCAQSKNGWVRISPDERIPIETPNSDSLNKRSLYMLDSMLINVTVNTVENQEQTKKHICSEYKYLTDAVTHKKELILVIYCYYDIQKKRTIHFY